MTAVALVRRLWDHTFWADDLILRALTARGEALPEAWREYTHTIGAEEVWLSRLEGRATRVPVWPALDLPETTALLASVRAGYVALLERLDDARLAEPLTYRNTAGAEFTNTVADILAHVALHGQYHRGKINFLLRSQGMEPGPADFITFARAALPKLSTERPPSAAGVRADTMHEPAEASQHGI
jgi:uncharacterized damage-inducible protein DinB